MVIRMGATARGLQADYCGDGSCYFAIAVQRCGSRKIRNCDLGLRNAFAASKQEPTTQLRTAAVGGGHDIGGGLRSNRSAAFSV